MFVRAEIRTSSLTALIFLALSPAASGLEIFKKHHPFDTDIHRQWTSLAGFTTDFVITGPAHLTINGHVNLVHAAAGSDVPVGWALVLSLEQAPTVAALGRRPGTEIRTPTGWIRGSKTGANVMNLRDHYAQGNFEGYAFLDSPGAYRVKLWANAHSAIEARDGLLKVLTDASDRVNGTYNQMIVRVEPAR
jgi:hypothetical protein